MMKDVFLLVKDPENRCRDIIYHQGSNLRMLVTCMNEAAFDPDAEELHFYGDNNGEYLAFETANYDADDPGLIIEAIRWYARYIGNPQMEILADDPRPASKKSSYR